MKSFLKESDNIISKKILRINELYQVKNETLYSFLMKYFDVVNYCFSIDIGFFYLLPELSDSNNDTEYFFYKDNQIQTMFAKHDYLNISLENLDCSKVSSYYDPEFEIFLDKFQKNFKGPLIRPFYLHGKYYGGFGFFSDKLENSFENEILCLHLLNVLTSTLSEIEFTDRLKRLQHIREVYKIALDKTCFILFTNKNGLVTYSNQLFKNLSGNTKTDIFGKRLNELFNFENEDYFSSILTNAYSGLVWSGECWIENFQNEKTWLMTTIIPHLDIDNKVNQLVIICYDITAQKIAQDELITAKVLAEEAAKSKSIFLSNMSHEIRTPLNAIVGIVDILGEDQLTIEQRRNLSILRNSTHNLLTIVNDILDFSKIESNTLDIVDTDFILRESIEEPCLLHSQNAARKKIQFYCDVDESVDCVVRGDRIRLEQILSNLISNAIKFTENGKVFIKVTSFDSDSRGNVLFEIRDSGEGIAQEDIPKLFSPFSQLDSDLSKKAAGTGLGLSICKNLVELLGGKIWIESVKGVGTSVLFTVDFKSIQPIENNVLVLKEIEHDQDVLIVLSDDNVLSHILGTFLRGTHVDKYYFTNFISLIEWLDFSLNNEKVALVIDLACLQEISIDMMKEIVNKYAQITKTIILNTLGKKDVEFSSREAGFTHLYASPLLKSEFVTALKGQQTKVSFSNTYYDVSNDLNLKILLVDDVEDNRILIKTYLKKYQCEIVESDSGLKAIELFKTREFDVVLMDIQMPEVDGVFATKQIRAYEQSLQLSPVVIVALTAFVQEEERELFLKAGCNFHLSKPIKKNVLLKSLENIVRKKNSRVA